MSRTERLGAWVLRDGAWGIEIGDGIRGDWDWIGACELGLRLSACGFKLENESVTELRAGLSGFFWLYCFNWTVVRM